ncbi:MAG: hypothetical protein M1816_006797 [Peltula sp. TS41687]|nr:MAG: hypothetical protein M1816_006797 [Peltula sp. TS41687]
MERRAALLDPPVRVPGAHQAPSQAFLQEELSVEDMERMGRLADMCLHVVRDGYEAIRARTDDLILRDQEAQRRGETSEGGKDLPTLDDRQAEIKRREEKAFTGGGFNAFMSRVGKILPKGPNAQSFAAFGTAAIGGFMRVPTVL